MCANHDRSPELKDMLAAAANMRMWLNKLEERISKLERTVYDENTDLCNADSRPHDSRDWMQDG